MGPYLFRAVVVFAYSVNICYGAQIFLTVPKEVYYDSNLVVSVTAFGMEPQQKESVSLEYRGLKDHSRVLNSTTLEMSSDGSQTWTVVFSWDTIQQLDEVGVQLRMAAGFHEVKKDLYFSNNFGYIFIQTDKPIYTPMQSVKFRVIAVDEYQKLAKYLIKIDIKNNKEIVVDRMRYTAEEAFKAKEFELPKDTPPGVWSITANFEGMGNSTGQIQTVKFEVREYVLPRFSSSVSVEPDVITKGTQWITVNVTSWYVYGRPLLGKVNVKFGIWDSSNNFITMFRNEYNAELQNGQFREDVLVGQYLTDEAFSQDNRLYVKVTVTETALMESQTYEDTSTFISHPYYVIDFLSSKKYFKPGFPYTLQARASAKSGRVASWTKLHITPVFQDASEKIIGGQSGFYDLNEDGELEQDFDIPPGAVNISFNVIVVDLGAPKYKLFTLKVEQYRSPNNQYIHISLTAPIKRNKDGNILLRYTKPDQPVTGSGYTLDSITVLILAKGHIIYTTKTVRALSGTSNVPLPSRLSSEISPSMRIVAYFYVQTSSPEFVVDSLLVDTPDVCVEEIFLSSSGGLYSARSQYKPKDKFIINVDGGSEMTVGFVAVDKAVSYLTLRQTLNRNLLFGQLGSHDKGLDGGDGSSLDKVLENSGLGFLHIDANMNRAMVESVMSVKIFEPLGISTGASGKTLTLNEPAVSSAAEPPQSVRNYFPESWFFEERQLSKNGFLELDLTLPDSVTTWSFLAVGISSNRGVCVSKPLEQRVMKLFFADVRLPYKATRLEEVKIQISVYNYQAYQINVNVIVTGSDGLCFSANTARGNVQNSTSFTLNINAGQAQGISIKVIPLKMGDLNLRVHLDNGQEKDIVERKLHVVAEGQRVKKSITFVLDPEAKHATFRPSKRNKTALYESLMINNTFDLKNSEQQTRIDLALPSNVIKGTESCKISAFGDLMGDIIQHSVVESRNLVGTSQGNAEEALGNLAPTVHALHSAQIFGLLDSFLKKRGSKFVSANVTSLIKYQLDNFSYSLTSTTKSAAERKPSIWLTAFALKTLCHANLLVYVDRKSLIHSGLGWLLGEVRGDGMVAEKDQRITMSSTEYSILLASEVLITILECNKFAQEKQCQLQDSTACTREADIQRLNATIEELQQQKQKDLSGLLERSLKDIKDPLILAKVTYALVLMDPTSKRSEEAVKQLQLTKRRGLQGHFYWSKIPEIADSKDSPYWFHSPPHASAIEATAYALMAFLKLGGINVDAIADWLVGQRNYNGAFIGAMDSAAAIQALSQYSLLKQGPQVNLHCNVSSDRKRDLHSFKFTERNAISRESLLNVPVGRVLDVLTHGQGLGQMQINIEYNIPINKNQNCTYKVIVNVSRSTTTWSPDMNRDPMCAYCNIGCKKPAVLSDIMQNNLTAAVTVKPVEPAGQMIIRAPYSRGNRTQGNGGKKKRKMTTRNPLNKTQKVTRKKPIIRKPTKDKKSKKLNNQSNARQKRALNDQPAASRHSICIQVCLQHAYPGLASPTELRIEMLTGHTPVTTDIDKILETPDVESAAYDPDSEFVTVKFKRISCTEQTCIAFRAIQMLEVERMMPAVVEVRPTESAIPHCVTEYHGLPNHQSLQVYCADFAHRNKGECRCYSGLCSMCISENREINSYELNKLFCKSQIIYQLQIANVTTKDSWSEVKSKVISLYKTGSHDIVSGSTITMMAQASCTCPVVDYRNPSDMFYMLSADVEKMVDRKGRYVYRYLLDEHSTFMTAAEPPSRLDSNLRSTVRNTKCEDF
jgi:hypothetical protein